MNESANGIFAGKVVVVTGAGSGIGRGLAAGFCRDGADVVGFGRTKADLDETAARHGLGRMTAVVGSVAKMEDVDRLFAEAVKRHGRVDILVNNAALYPKHAFLGASFDEWKETVEVNVIGLAYCCYKALPGMLERGYGRILNVGTFAWKGPIPRASAYSASKGAIPPLTKAIASEIDRTRHPDVLVNEFIPGIVKSRMSDSGDDPMNVYPHARHVASLPSGGPTGETFLRSELQSETPRLKTRLGRMVRRALGGR